MKKITVFFVLLSCTLFSMAQDSTVIPTKDTVPTVIDTLPIKDPTLDTLPSKNPKDLIEQTESEKKNAKKAMALSQLGLANRSKDHLLLQLGADNWANKPDTIKTKGLSRSFNIYLMFDFPFKTNPHLSVAVGAGVGTSSIYFSKTYVDIAGKNANKLSFNDVSDTIHFKKYKLMTTYVEAPVEFRYVRNPANPKKSFKAAIGAKIGTMLGAGTKGKTLQNTAGNTINPYTLKEKSKRYFNTTRLAVTGRVGFGALSLFGSYQVNAFVKQGFGPDVRPYSIGITMSGL
jgi:hypothetical protein